MGKRIVLSKSAKAKLERAAKKDAKELATECRDRLEEKYEEIIDRFYSEYSPEIYRRHETYGMVRGMKKTFKPFLKKDEVSYKGGIVISEKDMYHDKIYRGKTYQVLYSFLAGFHGLPHNNLINTVKMGEKLNDYYENSGGEVKEMQYKFGYNNMFGQSISTLNPLDDNYVGSTRPLKEMREFYEELVEEMKNRLDED